MKMENTFVVSAENLAKAKALMNDTFLTNSIDVAESMKNGSEEYDEVWAVQPFRNFVDSLYVDVE